MSGLINGTTLDDKGCNADSTAYKSVDYKKTLTVDKSQEVQKYILSCLTQQEPLEVQDLRKGGEAFLVSQNILGRKILFVPLQRPSDTVIKYHIGGVQSFDNFVNVIDKLAEKLKSYGWVTIVKKHPLETVKPKFSNVIFAPDEANFLDLLDCCDATALINSGVGVYSMMMEKPCYIFGEAFYAISDVNYCVSTKEYEDENAIEALVKKIVYSETSINKEKMYKFIDFLINDFYSFGRPKTKQRVEADNSLRTITTGIEFYDLKIHGKRIFKYSSLSKNAISKYSPLFEKYALDVHNKKIKASKSEPINRSNAKQVHTKASGQPKPIQYKSNHVQFSSLIFKPAEIKQKFSINKWNKLKNNPYKFFSDSKSPILKKLRVFFEK